MIAQAVRDKPHMERVDLNGTHAVELVLLFTTEEITRGFQHVGKSRVVG